MKSGRKEQMVDLHALGFHCYSPEYKKAIPQKYHLPKAAGQEGLGQFGFCLRLCLCVFAFEALCALFCHDCRWDLSMRMCPIHVSLLHISESEPVPLS